MGVNIAVTSATSQEMDTATIPINLVLDLEARHEDLLLRIDELDKRVQQTLAEWQKGRPAASPGAMPTA